MFCEIIFKYMFRTYNMFYNMRNVIKKDFKMNYCTRAAILFTKKSFLHRKHPKKLLMWYLNHEIINL